MKNIAIIGAGMAGITAARTLLKAGHKVTVFEKSLSSGGRMATRATLLGNFDHGTQYFTVRDARFELALNTVPGTQELIKPWSVTSVRVLDAHGSVLEAARPPKEPHFVAKPGMDALVEHWSKPIPAQHFLKDTQVNTIQVDPKDQKKWLLKTSSKNGKLNNHAGFDHVILAIPAPQVVELLMQSTPKIQETGFIKALKQVEIGPCWTLMIAFPQASQPGLAHLGPQWNAAKSTHHRIAWLSRESSKPARGSIERWTIQANTKWSSEHLHDDPSRITGKLLKGFSELTGIYAEPGRNELHRWLYAQTIKPLGQPFLWDAQLGVGTCGDWHIGHRVEDAFVSGLSLALAI